jgi:predicted ribosomally synthesized peptide with SipW-like signal peptide
MSKKKLLCTAAAGILAVGIGVSASLAYMTATAKKDNVFTIGTGLTNSDGTSKITLTEGAWNDTTSGKNVIAGQTIAKSPTVNNTSDIAIYAFIKIEEPLITGNDGNLTPLFEYIVNSGWTAVSQTTSGTTRTTVYGYCTDKAMTSVAAGKSVTVFDSVTIYNYNSGNAVEGTTQHLVATAYAIQKDEIGVTAPEDVYALVKDL